jgi:hypothetical protein
LSNNGKTAIARRFTARMVPPENAAARASMIPVTLIQAPNGPRIPQLLTAIRSALGQPAGRRETTRRSQPRSSSDMADFDLEAACLVRLRQEL